MRISIAATALAIISDLAIAAPGLALDPSAISPRAGIKKVFNPQLTASWDRWTLGGTDSFITEGVVKSKRGGEVFTFTNPIRFDTGDPNTIIRFSLRLIWERVTSRQVQYRPDGQGGRTISATEKANWHLAGGSEGEIGFQYGRLIVFAAAGGEINERSWEFFYALRPGWEITRGLRVFAAADLLRWGPNGYHPSVGVGIGINRR